MITLERKHGLLMDIDDTLIATHPNAFKKAEETANLLGLSPPSRDKFYRLYNYLPFEECIRAMHPELSVDLYKECYNSLQSRFPDQLIADLPLLLRLQQRVACLGILTNGPCDKTDRKLAALGIAMDIRSQLFRCVFHADNLSYRKPDKRCFDEAKTVLKPYAEKILYVGDSIGDWIASRDAEIEFIAVMTGTHTREDFVKMGLPEGRIISSIHELVYENDNSTPATQGR